MEEAWDSTGGAIDRLPELQTLYDWNSGRSLFIEPNQIRLQKIKMKTSDEKILTTIKSFVRGTDQVSLLETSDYIRAVGTWQLAVRQFAVCSQFGSCLVSAVLNGKRLFDCKTAH